MSDSSISDSTTVASGDEAWTVIPGTDDRYSVSTRGRVRSEPVPGRMDYDSTRKRGNMLRPGPDNRGYCRFTIRLPGGGRRTLHVHRLVATAFIGPCPEGMQVNHKNGVKTDNRVENLEYATPAENIQHASATGLLRTSKGSRHYKAKLTEDSVRAIRANAATMTLAEQAAAYGVSKTTVCGIIRGRLWTHVK